MAKILLNDASDAQPYSDGPEEKKTLPNIFQGRENPQQEVGNAKFPDWDILPPDQIINPRLPKN